MSESESKCKFAGLPQVGEVLQCDHCHKPRLRADVLRCRKNGPRIEGLGDLVEIATRVTGIKAVVKAIAPDCDCPGKHLRWNQKFPIGAGPESDPSSQPESYRQQQAGVPQSSSTLHS